MINETALDEIVLEMPNWRRQKLVASLRAFDGGVYADLRKWIIFEKSNPVHTTKGLMLRVEDWPIAIKSMEELLARNNAK